MAFGLLSVVAFLLNNGNGYILAHAVGLVEYFAWSYFWPRSGSWWMGSGWLYFGTRTLAAYESLFPP
jgi:hypothetical protein